MLLTSPSFKTTNGFPSNINVLVNSSFRNGKVGGRLNELNPKSKLVTFIPTSTLSSIIKRELWLKSRTDNLVSIPKVSSFRRDIPLCDMSISDNLGLN